MDTQIEGDKETKLANWLIAVTKLSSLKTWENWIDWKDEVNVSWYDGKKYQTLLMLLLNSL